MQNTVALDLADRYVRGTGKAAIVQSVQALVCEITITTMHGIGCQGRKVYLNTRVLKHMYDKRPAEEFDFLIRNAYSIIRFPDVVYRNKNPKRGDFVFVKTLKNQKYLCSIEQVVQTATGDFQLEVVTLFRFQKERYLSSYGLLWEWKGGKPSS